MRTRSRTALVLAPLVTSLALGTPTQALAAPSATATDAPAGSQVTYLGGRVAWVADGLGRSPRELKYTRNGSTLSWSSDSTLEARAGWPSVSVGSPGQPENIDIPGVSVAFAPVTPVLAIVGSYPAKVSFYDVRDSTTRSFKAPGGALSIVGWSPDEKTLVLQRAGSGTAGATFLAFDVASGGKTHIRLARDVPADSAQVGPDGRLYVLGGPSGRGGVWSQALNGTGVREEFSTPRDWSVSAFGFDASGELLVARAVAGGTTVHAVLADGTLERRAAVADRVSLIRLKAPFPVAPDACRQRNATLRGTPGDDVLHGTPGDDVILGLAGHDTIDGGGGNDVICGGEGNDVVSGGEGDDWISGDEGNDSLDGGDGDDIVRGFLGRDTLTGGPGNDTVAAGSVDVAGNDDESGGVASGGPGKDVVLGSLGDDILHGDSGDDRLAGRGGPDTLYGDDGADFLWGGPAAVLHGGNGDDYLESAERAYGEAGNDHITWAMTVDGGTGDDGIWFTGGRQPRVGPVEARAGSGDDSVFTRYLAYPADVDLGTGDDRVDLGWHGPKPVTEPSVVRLGSGNDTARTSGGPDQVFGGPGNDTISTSSGKDLLDGGPGNDGCDGGDGRDTARACETTEAVEVSRP